MNILEITLKLLLAVGLGGLIGLERETSQKPAGFRTNILICVGSTMVMIASGLILQGREGGGGDLTRIAAGVITGIGKDRSRGSLHICCFPHHNLSSPLF